MGAVELLSREGEIAIAKRIEAGREAMIAGLCESPLTFQAIIIWRDELNDSKALLRDIIDLEATYAGPDGKNTPKDRHDGAGGRPKRWPRNRRPAIAPLDPPARLRRPSEDGGSTRQFTEEAFDEEDDMDNRLLVGDGSGTQAARCSKCSRGSRTTTRSCVGCRINTSPDKLKNETLTPSQERKYKKLKKAIIADVKSLSLNRTGSRCWSISFTTSTSA